MNVLKLILVAAEDPIRQTPALRRGVELARRTGAKLHLCLTVFDWAVDAASDLVNKQVGRLARKQFLEERLKTLVEFVAELTPDGLEVDFEVVWSGKPHDALLARALELQPDLLVKDLVRESRLGRWWTVRGSDLHLARQCPVPLMLVQKAGILLPKRIAAAVDPGRTGSSDPQGIDERIVRAALPIAMAAEAKLGLVHVCKYRRRLTGVGPNLDHYMDSLRKEDDRAFVEFARRHGVQEEDRAMLNGEINHELLDFVDSTGVDLLVMGSEHRTGFERFMIGSTAEAVISKGSCDVLLVRPEGFIKALQKHRDLDGLVATYRTSS